MGGVCVCHSWTCRTAWPLFLLLASMAGVLHSSESPPAVVGKMYPRGNHWAVGHLMGKKSVGLPPARGDTSQVGEVLTPSQLQPYARLMEALVQHKSRGQTAQPSALRLLWLHNGWREEDRDKYLREIAELLFLAIKLQTPAERK